jgi:hypothetical protein
VWNGTAITVPYGGTGLTSLTANYIPYGNGTSAFQSSSTFTFDGTTELAPAMGASNGLLLNAIAVASSYTIPTNYNAVSAGPITVNSSVTVTVPTGSSWSIV